MAFERKDYGMNSGIPFIRIADRVEVNVAPEGERISDPRWSGRSSNRRGFVLFARGWIEYGCGPDYRWGKPRLSRFPGGDARMRYLSQEQRSIFLLAFILLFIILTSFLEGDPGGELILVINMYLTLVAATMELKEKRTLFLSAIPIAATSMVLLFLNYFRPTRGLSIASGVVLAVFLGLVSVSLFAYLGRRGQITSGRIYVSVSLYFLLGIEWYALYSLLNAIQPGSFVEAGVTLVDRVHGSKFLYFSLATLITLGYGDIVAVRPAARMLAALEAAAGVLYIAITVARLVASYQTISREDQAG
jgi:hypothetical protein